MSRTPVSQRRRGAALIGVLVALALLAVMLESITWQVLSSRRVLERHQYAQQALWLARSGAELAMVRLRENPDEYRGESPELIPLAELQVEVKPDQNAKDTFLISCTARYPTDAKHPVVRRLTRVFRLE